MSQELNEEYWKKLVTAVRHNDAEQVKQLIADVDVEELNKYQHRGSGNTLLVEAVHMGNEETIDVLLAKGVDVNGATKTGRKPLGSYYALSPEGRVKANRINKKLLNAGAIDETGEYTKSQLLEAVEQNDLAKVKELVANKVDVNADNKDKKPLWSVAIDKPEIFKVLCEAGLDLELPNKQGHTALMHALYIRDDKLAKDLIDAGANVNAKSNGRSIEGCTPLHFARSASIVEELIKAGADVNAADKYGDVPAVGKSLDALKVMYKNGAKLDGQDSSGLTFMARAAMGDDIEKIKFLQSIGQDINAVDGNGNAPIKYAAAAKNMMGSFETRNGIVLIKTTAPSAEFVQQMIDCGAKVSDTGALDVVGQQKEDVAIAKVLKQAQKEEQKSLKKDLKMQKAVADKKLEHAEQHKTEKEEAKSSRSDERAAFAQSYKERE